MGLLRRALPLLALGALASCSGNGSNPFEDFTPTVPPRAASRIVFTSNGYSTTTGAGRELFAVDGDGSNATRLTFCNNGSRPCDIAEVSPAPDRLKVAMLRVLGPQGETRIRPQDSPSLVLMDLGRSVEAEIVPASSRPTSVDWSGDGTLLIYSAFAAGGLEDVQLIDPSGKNQQALTNTPTVRERRPRLNATAAAAVFERIDASGKGQIAAFSGSNQLTLTTGGAGTEALTGTPYVVGSDADPSFAPNTNGVAFRRLTSTGIGGVGSWDILALRLDLVGATPTVVATGAAYRGGPDWGADGIVFVEVDATGVNRLVVVQPDGSGRKVLLTTSGGITLSAPRWLPAAP